MSMCGWLPVLVGTTRGQKRKSDPWSWSCEAARCGAVRTEFKYSGRVTNKPPCWLAIF